MYGHRGPVCPAVHVEGEATLILVHSTCRLDVGELVSLSAEEMHRFRVSVELPLILRIVLLGQEVTNGDLNDK